jgi:hypothetical protein
MAAAQHLQPHFPRRTDCQQQRALEEAHAAVAPRICGDASTSAQALYARSYTLQARWPFDPFHLIMETQPGTCDLYRLPTQCCMYMGDYREPEIHVRQALASLLMHCVHRSPDNLCRSVDLGANNGWFTAMMLQLGSRVLSIEPQVDFARAIRETAALVRHAVPLPAAAAPPLPMHARESRQSLSLLRQNCWANRSTVINARACSRHAGNGVCMKPTPSGARA